MLRSSTKPLPLLDENKIIKSEQIESGAYGSVYKGKYKKKNVAIKASVRGNSASLDSLEREISIISMLTRGKHANIIHYYGYLEKKSHFNGHTTRLSLVMDFADAGSLKNWLKSQTLHAGYWKTAKKLMANVISAVAYVHSKNVIHCDIKKDNVLLSTSRSGSLVAKLCDFGLAQTEPNDTRPVGTPIYLAPEILLSLHSTKPSPNTKSSDIFALALVLWEICNAKSITNEYPSFASLSDEIHYVAHEKKRPRFDKTCPNSMARLITWGWKHNPENRPSADDMVIIAKRITIK